MSGAVEHAFWTITIAAASGIPCAILGCFLLLKRMSLLADGIGHGVLPGIALAVLLTGSIGWPMLLGAMIFGVLTALLSEMLARQANSSEDSSLGVVFTAFFSFGVLLLSRHLRGAHVDLHCIGFGMLELTPLYFDEILPTLLLVLVLVVAFVALFWKELKLTTFDPTLARTLGMPVKSLHLALVALVAGTTVASFESFGSVLVLGMFIVPASTARLLTDRLGVMVVLASAFAFSACAIGYVFAWQLACNAAGMIIAVTGAQFATTFLFAPRYGLVAQGLRRFRLARRIASEEILATLYRAEEAGPPPARPSVREHALSSWLVRFAMMSLRRKDLIERAGAGFRLTDAGRHSARTIVRAHRLWEVYLEKNFDLPLDHLHAPASQIEHFLGPELQHRLADELAAPATDPHGRSIPEQE